jgi:LysM repeat protein
LNKDDEKDSGIKTDMAFDGVDPGDDMIEADESYDYSDEDEMADYTPSPLGFGRRPTVVDDDADDWRPKKEADPPAPRKARHEKPDSRVLDYSRAKEKSPGRAARQESAPRYRQVIPEDDYDDYEPEDNSAALKIIIAALCIIFLCVLAVLVYKINTVSTELEAANAKLEASYTQAQYQEIVDKNNANSIVIERLNNQIAALQGNGESEGENAEAQDVYTVESGDTLSAIASRFGVDLGTLMTLNDLESADMIKPGQKLLLRSAEEEAQP